MSAQEERDLSSLPGMAADDQGRPSLGRALSDTIVVTRRVAAMADEVDVSGALTTLGAVFGAICRAVDDPVVTATEERAAKEARG